MTRINALIPPAELCDQHLLAEHREIKRIPNQIKSGRYRLESAPSKFTLNKGHVSFFYDKLYYLLERYKLIHQECLKRGFNVTDYTDCWQGLPTTLFNDWRATYAETKRVESIMRERIADKMPKKPRFSNK